MDNNIPNNYKPLTPWAYFGYQLLFSIPVVGFILLIVFSFSDDNINRKNFARSYFCGLLVVVTIVAFLTIIGFVFGYMFA